MPPHWSVSSFGLSSRIPAVIILYFALLWSITSMPSLIRFLLWRLNVVRLESLFLPNTIREKMCFDSKITRGSLQLTAETGCLLRVVDIEDKLKCHGYKDSEIAPNKLHIPLTSHLFSMFTIRSKVALDSSYTLRWVFCSKLLSSIALIKRHNKFLHDNKRCGRIKPTTAPPGFFSSNPG